MRKLVPASRRSDSERASGGLLQEENNTPMMAIFGGVFGLLLVFLVVVNLYSDAAQRERLESGEQGQYRIERLDGGSGFVVLVFPGELRIIETSVSVSQDALCTANSPFAAYAERVYEGDGDQLVFFILEQSIPTMAIARECLRTMWPGRVLTIGWIIADNELLKSVALDDIPDYIREYVEERP